MYFLLKMVTFSSVMLGFQDDNVLFPSFFLFPDLASSINDRLEQLRYLPALPGRSKTLHWVFKVGPKNRLKMSRLSWGSDLTYRGYNLIYNW